MGNQVVGRVTFEWDGNVVPIMEADIGFNPGGVEREPMVTNDGRFVFKEKFVPATIDIDSTHMDDLVIADLRAATSVRATVKTDIGQRFVVANAAFLGFGDFKDGKAPLRFGGLAMEQT